MTRASDTFVGPWHRQLGTTGLYTSALVAGGGILGGRPDAYGQTVDHAEGVATMQALLASDIRGIDTANNLAGGESERRIGAAIEAVGLPDDFLVITKADPDGGDYSAGRVRISVAESMRRLGLDHLPLVMLHDPEWHQFDAITGPGGALEGLCALQAEGAIGRIGIAGGDTRVLEQYLAWDWQDGERIMDVLMLHHRWTLVDRSGGRLKSLAVDAGMSFINSAVFGGGALTGRTNPTMYGGRVAQPEVVSAITQMQQLCHDHCTDLRTAALQFSVRDPEVSATVVGVVGAHAISPLMDLLRTELPEDFWTALDDLVPACGFWLDAV